MTMSEVQEVIERHRLDLAQHPFLTTLEADGAFDQIQRMAPRLAFFVLCFQDVLRLVHERCEEEELKAMALKHWAEDAGHDRWYLQDLQRFGVRCDVEWLFSAAHQLTRDVGYSLVTEVLRATDDRVRLSIVLALEAIGSEFFGRVIGFLKRINRTEGLRYFASSHQLIERAHGVFEADSQQRLAAVQVSAQTMAEIIPAIGRVFGSMRDLATDLHGALVGPSTQP